MATRRPEVLSERREFDETATISVGPTPERLPRLAFGPFILDPETGRLLGGGRVVNLAPKPFGTLYHLAQRSGHVVPKAELMERIWAGTFVTDDVLVQCVMDIRRALSDTAKAPHYVETLSRRGYRFVAPVRVLSDEEASSVPIAATLTAPAPQGGAAPSGEAGRSRRFPGRTAAAAVVALVALGGMLWVTLRRTRPPLELAGAEKARVAEPGSLLVMPIFVPDDGRSEAWLRNGLAEMIRAQLGQTRGIHVVPRHQLAAALANAGISGEDASSGELASAIARALRAERLVTSSYVRVGDRFVLSAQVVDVFGTRTHAAAVVRGRHPNDLLDAVDALCLKLVQQLRPMAPSSADSTWQPTGLATHSIEASRHYVEAIDVWSRVGGRRGAEEAVAKLDVALKLDSSFAQAYVKKAEILQWLRTVGYGSHDPSPAILAASRLAKDLPEREQLLIQCLEALIVRHQPAAALRHMQSLLEIYPTYAQEAEIPGLLLETLMRLGRWDDMIRIGESQLSSTALGDYQRAAVSSVLAQAYRRKGEFGPALENARRAVQLWPVRERPEWLTQRAFLGRISLDAGRRDEALREFREMTASSGADASNFIQAAWGLYMAGELDEATAQVERGLALDGSYGSGHHLQGWMRLAQGDYVHAAQSLEKAYETTPAQFGRVHQGMLGGDLAALYYAGVAWQKAGQDARAQAVLARVIEHCHKFARGDSGAAARWQAANFIGRARARLGRSSPEPERLPEDDSTYFVQSARLHAAQGRTGLALRELGQGLALGFGERRHIQDDPDFESLRKEPAFGRLVTEPLQSLMASGVATASPN
jgi:DNA-binding winged helix-turn-helix (wHTH) protein/tetratricopeptide (TPR) repeat protein